VPEKRDKPVATAKACAMTGHKYVLQVASTCLSKRALTAVQLRSTGHYSEARICPTSRGIRTRDNETIPPYLDLGRGTCACVSTHDRGQMNYTFGTPNNSGAEGGFRFSDHSVSQQGLF